MRKGAPWEARMHLLQQHLCCATTHVAEHTREKESHEEEGRNEGEAEQRLNTYWGEACLAWVENVLSRHRHRF